MVTFVSQSEKNALKNTRRVLDAFANRIGDSTWQTVITEQGLQTVKLLLRKTASKSTAVSCHWIRSRARSQLLWVVGNKRKFNYEGVVPVNITEKEVFMDVKKPVPVKAIYANTDLQTLDQHLFSVGFIAQQLYKQFFPEKKNLANAAFVAGCFHDIGKLDPAFQNWVVKKKNKNYQSEDGQHINDTKFSFEKHPRHNEISALIYQVLDDKVLKSINPHNKSAIKHAIYWHHAKPFRQKEKNGFDTYGKIFDKLKNKSDKETVVSLISEQSIVMLDKVCELDKSYRGEMESFLRKTYITEFDYETLISYENTPLPEYKTYGSYDDIEDYGKKVRINAINNEIRACLITADRWVSSLSAIDLAHYIENKKLNEFIAEQLDKYVTIESDLPLHIQGYLSKFPSSERTKSQSTIAQRLVRDIDYAKVLAGAAGAGKTKIALEWAGLTKAQQIIWVCPRVQICQGIFMDLKESNDPSFKNASVELFTGEFKFTDSLDNVTPEDKYLTGDIVITTIDQLLGSVISHTKAERLLNYLSAHIVFDEYHEYIKMPGFNLLFAELLASRDKLNQGSRVLLVSATPHYYYLEKLLNFDLGRDIELMSSFNDRKYQLDFVYYDENNEDTLNPLYKKQNKDKTTFVISNTATTAQKSFIANLSEENAILLHSKYKKSDKSKIFNFVFESFRRGGTQFFDLLRSGPIVQAALNISCDYMVSEMTTAENCLQRMGRLDRFGLNEEINRYTIALPETSEPGKRRRGAVETFLASSNELESAKAWNTFLIAKTDNGGKVLNISEVYDLYAEFYNSYPAASHHLEKDMLAALKKSAETITAKISEPQTIGIAKGNISQRAKMSSNSIRGDNRFVQMALCNLDEKDAPRFVEEYAYSIPVSENVEIDNLTASCELIQGHGDSSSNLLIHMKNKHHNIMGGTKPYKDFILLNNARNPESPVYLSYSPNDLDGVGGESARHDSAIYYGMCKKQAIGAISTKNLTKRRV